MHECFGDLLGVASDHCTVRETNCDVLDTHVAEKELLKVVNTISWHTVEWITHGTTIWVEFVLKSTETVGIVALSIHRLVHLVEDRKILPSKR